MSSSTWIRTCWSLGTCLPFLTFCLLRASAYLSCTLLVVSKIRATAAGMLFVCVCCVCCVFVVFVVFVVVVVAGRMLLGICCTLGSSGVGVG